MKGLPGTLEPLGQAGCLAFSHFFATSEASELQGQLMPLVTEWHVHLDQVSGPLEQVVQCKFRSPNPLGGASRLSVPGLYHSHVLWPSEHIGGHRHSAFQSCADLLWPVLTQVQRGQGIPGNTVPTLLRKYVASGPPNSSISPWPSMCCVGVATLLLVMLQNKVQNHLCLIWCSYSGIWKTCWLPHPQKRGGFTVPLSTCGWYSFLKHALIFIDYTVNINIKS